MNYVTIVCRVFPSDSSANRCPVPVIPRASRSIRIESAWVKVMSRADAADIADRGAEVLVVASDEMPVQDPATALVPGFAGTLLTPPDLAVQRFNVGIRTLEEGAMIVVTLRNPDGATIRMTTVTYPPNYAVQLAADQLMQTSQSASPVVVE